MLDGLLTKLKAQGHRVLIYSQMTRMIDLLEVRQAAQSYSAARVDCPVVLSLLCRTRRE